MAAYYFRPSYLQYSIHTNTEYVHIYTYARTHTRMLRCYVWVRSTRCAVCIGDFVFFYLCIEFVGNRTAVKMVKHLCETVREGKRRVTKQ